MSIDIKNKTMKLICVCLIFFVISSCFCGCNYGGNINISRENVVDKLNNEELDNVLAKIKDRQHPCFTELVCVSKDKVILNGNVGLIVYDLQNREIVRAVDLTDIHMNLIQGDDVTIFEASEDGNKILMYNSIFYYKPSDDGNFVKDEKKELEGKYLYDVENDSLVKTDIDKLDNEYILQTFDKEFNEDDDMEYIGCANLDGNNICYLAIPKCCDEMTELKIILLNKDTNEKQIYNIF